MTIDAMPLPCRYWLPAAALALAALCVPLAAPYAAAPSAPDSAQPARTPPLRGIVLLSDRQQLDVHGVATAPPSGIDAARVQAIPAGDARRVIEPFLGKPIDGPLTLQIRKALQDYFIGIHQPFVSVIVPPQIVDSGVVQVIVLVGRLGQASVAGNHWFDAGQYTGALHVRPGEPINGALLDADIDWLDQNQYRHATVVAQPGQQFGTTDLVIRAQDRFPLSVNAGFDDTGNKATSIYRLSTGFDWGNAFWRGDDLNYEFTSAPDPRLLSQHVLSYTFNLPWHDSLSLSGSYATTNSLPSGIINTTGVTGIASPRYNVLLPPVWGIQQALSLGYDFKTTNNNILFGGVSVFPTTTEIDQFIATYNGSLADLYGNTSLALTLVGSPGGLTSDNNDATFASQQPGATANYIYTRAVIDRLVNLPGGFSWHARLTGQLSDANLLPSEQLIFGGFQSIRGFVEQGATRDEGVTWQNELRAPTLATGAAHFLHLDPDGDSLVPFWFVDIGGGRDHHQLGSQWVSLASTGPGLTWNIARNFTFRFTWGIPLMRVGAFVPLLGPQGAIQITF